MKRLAAFTALPLAALLLLTEPAHAYLDPGTGSLLLQGLIAGAAAASVAVGAYWARIRAFFSPKSEPSSEPSRGPDEQ
jgi:hypothetical protein